MQSFEVLIETHDILTKNEVRMGEKVLVFLEGVSSFQTNDVAEMPAFSF